MTPTSATLAAVILACCWAVLRAAEAVDGLIERKRK